MQMKINAPAFNRFSTKLFKSFLGVPFHELSHPKETLGNSITCLLALLCSASWPRHHLDRWSFQRWCVFLQLSQEKAAGLKELYFCCHLGWAFSPIWIIWGFGVQTPAARWIYRRDSPMSQPSSDLFNKPLASEPFQWWCSPAYLCSRCLFWHIFLFFLVAFWLHLWL